MASQKILIEIKAWEQQAQVDVADARNFANWLLVVAEGLRPTLSLIAFSAEM